MNLTLIMLQQVYRHSVSFEKERANRAPLHLNCLITHASCYIDATPAVNVTWCLQHSTCCLLLPGNLYWLHLIRLVLFALAHNGTSLALIRRRYQIPHAHGERWCPERLNFHVATLFKNLNDEWDLIWLHTTLTDVHAVNLRCRLCWAVDHVCFFTHCLLRCKDNFISKCLIFSN